MRRKTKYNNGIEVNVCQTVGLAVKDSIIIVHFTGSFSVVVRI